MSQNRGFRRDNRPSYQMNSSHYGRSAQHLNVNPWEGGMVPGGHRSGVAGLLPTPPQASNLISQLSTPEAQLAIASNLLTTLLRPQQQPQVPSLLSLGALSQINAGPGYRQQSNYGQNQGRYQDNRRKSRMDSRRLEPYNKMGNRTRDSQTVQGRRPTPSKGGPERKPGAQGYRSPNVGKARPTSGAKVGGKPEKKDDKDDKKDNDDEEEEEEENDNANEVKNPDEEDSKREDGDESEEKKRDWKDEKKPEEGEIVEDDENKNKDDKASEKDTPDKRTGSKGSRYSGIPNGLFFCHVCKKHMWDDHSFENHLKGRTHQLMMEKLEESYKIKVDLMRHELQVAEQQREIEMERIKRQGKKVQMNSREYCTMCDLYFYGNIVIHRKTERHQQLKSFLHPRCLPCGKEFPTRVEWDHHKLTALHLRKTAEARKNRKAGSDDEFGIEDFIASDNGERRDIKVRTREEEENDIIEADKHKGDKDGEKDDKEDGKSEGKDIGSVEDSSGNLRYRIPKYNPDVAVGQSLLKKVVGQTCRGCHRFFLHDDDAKTHCRTLSHYNNYIELVKTKARVMNQERRDAMASSKKKEEGQEKGKRAIEEDSIDDEGNWKRRKVTNANDDDEDAAEETPEAVETPNTEMKSEEEAVPEETKDKVEVDVVEEEIEDPSSKIPPGQEKYDPLEADNDSPVDDDKEKPCPEENQSETKVKTEDIVDDDNLWAEVDRDIGNLLETVEGEGEAESPAGTEEPSPKADKESEEVKSAPRTRGNASNRGTAPSPRGGRGRKKK